MILQMEAGIYFVFFIVKGKEIVKILPKTLLFEETKTDDIDICIYYNNIFYDNVIIINKRIMFQ